MITTITYAPDSFTLNYVPEQQLLVGRWLRPALLDEVQVHYAALLAAAQAHNNCRHWLLDVRRRQINDPAVVEWFGGFSQQLPLVLGQPVVLAYFAMVDQGMAREERALLENMRRGELLGSRYCYFNQEREALAWLIQQP